MRAATDPATSTLAFAISVEVLDPAPTVSERSDETYYVTAVVPSDPNALARQIAELYFNLRDVDEYDLASFVKRRVAAELRARMERDS